MRTIRHLLPGLMLLLMAGCQSAPMIPIGAGIATGGTLEPGIVSIYTYRPDGVRGSRMQGTGFFISNDVVVTNFHVIEGAQRATVRFADGVDHMVSAVLGDDLDADLVLLRVEGVDDPTPLPVSRTLPGPGKEVRAVGSPEGQAQSMVLSVVGSRVVSFDVLDEAVMLTTSIRGGMSGAPVFDGQGHVVGVLSRGTNVERQSYMVPASRIDSMKRFDRPMPVAAWNRWRRRSAGAAGRALFGEAAAVYERGSYDHAVQLLRRALDVGLSPAAEATAWYVIGDARVNQGREDDAIRAYRESLRIMPRHALSRAALGAVFRRQRLVDPALKAYRAALDLMPGSGSFHVGMGWSWIQKGSPQAAHDAFERATQIEPQDAAAWTGMAAASLELGRFDDARNSARRATELRPDVPQAYWVLAAALTRLGAWSPAVDALEAGLTLRPRHAPAMFELGRAHLELGDHARALEQRDLLRERDADLGERLGRLLAQATRSQA